MQFARRIPLTVEALRRIAPVCAAGRRIAVAASDDSIMEIVGTCSIGDELTVEVAGAGRLFVGILPHLAPTLVLRDGVAEFPTTPSDRTAFLQLLEKYWQGSSRPFEQRVRNANALYKILGRMRAEGHGGALLLVPTGWAPNGVEFAYELASPFETALPTFNLANLDPQALADLQIQTLNVRNHTLDAIAFCGAVDGALVLDEAVTLLGFGARLSESKYTAEVCQVDLLRPDLNPQVGQMHDGTRHTSAAAFVAANHEAIAFVVSQDGPLSVLLWLSGDQRVIVIRNAEMYLR